MAPENIRADLDELGGYSAKAAGLSGRVGDVAGKHLANQQVGADMLGDLGEESGMHGHIESTVAQLNEASKTGSSYLGSLGHAVAGARDDYHADEQLHAESFGRIQRDRLDGN